MTLTQGTERKANNNEHLLCTLTNNEHVTHNSYNTVITKQNLFAHLLFVLMIKDNEKTRLTWLFFDLNFNRRILLSRRFLYFLFQFHFSPIL